MKGLAVFTEFDHAAGQMNFQLGTFAPNHPSHASMRFPGFFMYAVEAKLEYVEAGRVQASAVETLWYSPRFLQVVKVVREASSPS